MLLQIEEIQLTIALGSMVIIFFTIIIIVTITQYRQRIYQHELEKEQLKIRFSEVLLKSQLEIKEQTLENIGFELHDNLGQVASLIKINLNTLNLGDPQKAEQQIEDTKELMRQLITDLKSLSLSLNTDRVIHLGFVTALETEIERINKTGQFVATLVYDSAPILDPNTTIILYRMVQEMLNNSVKHSNAKLIVISLKTLQNLFILECKDDGIGFDLEEKQKSGGLGLLNLQNRSKLINAKLAIQSAPENGTIISIELPV